MNWKTTLGAFVAMLAGIAPMLGIEIPAEVQSSIVVIGLFIVGIFAKDKDVTGGKRVQE